MSTKTKLQRREFATLAKVADRKKHNIAGWLMSEKLDGTRCIWDGGISRGLPTDSIPWAGITHPKTLQRKDKIKPIATGLWSRYGNPIIAPDWFLDQLPPIILDGELFAGRGNFQTCRSIVSGDTADDRWKQISYKVYGTPSLEMLTQPGLIKSPQMYCEIPETALQDVLSIITQHEKVVGWATADTPFRSAISDLSAALEVNEVCEVHLQSQLPHDNDLAWDIVEQHCLDIVEKGGEGLIVRNPDVTYETKRTPNLLKVKPLFDDEGIVTDFIAGKGKLEGMMGSMVLNYRGKRLELSGFTNAERELTSTNGVVAGKPLPPSCQPRHFSVGDTITFTYRELSDAGIPKEARFLRTRSID